MTNPAMDRPSVAFAHMMDRAVIFLGEGSNMVCQDCGDVICDLDDGDSIRTLVNTALAHTC